MGPKIVLKKTKIKGIFIGNIKPFIDNRGQFDRLFDFNEISKILCEPIKEINLSKNRLKGTVRGLHYENSDISTFKIIKCIRGEIIDKIVDIRKNSKTFLKTMSIELSENDNNLIFIPNKVAHGFQTLKDNTEILYMHTSTYDKSIEGGLNISDPKLNLKWKNKITSISARDKNFPNLNKEFDGI